MNEDTMPICEKCSNSMERVLLLTTYVWHCRVCDEKPKKKKKLQIDFDDWIGADWSKWSKKSWDL